MCQGLLESNILVIEAVLVLGLVWICTCGNSLSPVSAPRVEGCDFEG